VLALAPPCEEDAEAAEGGSSEGQGCEEPGVLAAAAGTLRRSPLATGPTALIELIPIPMALPLPIPLTPALVPVLLPVAPLVPESSPMVLGRVREKILSIFSHQATPKVPTIA